MSKTKMATNLIDRYLLGGSKQETTKRDLFGGFDKLITVVKEFKELVDKVDKIMIDAGFDFYNVEEGGGVKVFDFGSVKPSIGFVFSYRTPDELLTSYDEPGKLKELESKLSSLGESVTFIFLFDKITKIQIDHKAR